MATCPSPNEVELLRAELAQEREARARAEGELAGFERAVALLIRERQQAAPSREASVTPTVTQEGEEKRKRELAQGAARAQAYRVRQRDGVTASVTPAPTPTIPAPPPPSANDRRGALTLVTVSARDAQRDGERDDEVRALRDAWNELAAPHGFARWERTSSALRRDALSALRRRPLEEWRRVFALVPRSPVCRGELSSGQRTSLVWLLVGRTRDGYEPAEKLLTGAWSIDKEAEEPLLEEPGAAMCQEGVPTGTEEARAWSQVLTGMRSERLTYALRWLERMRPTALDDGHLVLECPDRHFRDWVEDHYGSLLRERVGQLGHAGIRLTLAQALEAPTP